MKKLAIIAILIVVCLTGCTSSSYLKGIQDTTIDGYGCTYKEAFDNFFEEPKWDVWMCDYIAKVFTFTGKCTYDDEVVEVEMLFRVTDEYANGLFEFQHDLFKINGEKMPITMMNTLIEVAAESCY